MAKRAKQIEFGKFLIIGCTAGELMAVTGAAQCVCDWCGSLCHKSYDGYYIAVLNQWFCKECFEEWKQRAVWYPEDASIERKNFDFYAPLLGVKCQ